MLRVQTGPGGLPSKQQQIGGAGLLAAGLIVAAGFLWTRHELRNGRRAYRAQQVMFSGGRASPFG